MLLALLLISRQVAPADLDSVLQSPLLKGSVYSAYVTKLDGTVIYDRNSTTRLLPASNEKLFTACFALHDLGVDYHPTTRFWKMKDRVVVDTTGDPMLTYADFNHAKQELQLSGHEPVYVHEPYRVGYLSQWELGDLPNKYAAPVTALTVDRGGFDLWADSQHVYLQPDAYGTKIDVRKSDGRRHWEYDPFTKTISYWGRMPDSPTELDTLSIAEPDKAAASILGDSFHPTEDVPATAPDLVLEGPVLPQILKECLVHSDNNLAENLLLLTAIKSGDLGDEPYRTATAREKQFIVGSLGLDPDEFHPVDGCGLGRQNMVTTHAIARVLQYESSQPTFNLWKECLASPGNGTLKDRLKDSTFIGKTGSLNGVTALSGYVTTKDGQTLVVSLVFNHHTGSNNQIRGLEDEFIEKLGSSTLSGTVLEGSALRESHLAIPSTRPVLADRLH